MTLSRRTLLASAASALALATAPSFAQDSFPNKPVRIIVPFSAGGIVDSIARAIADKLSARYPQPVIVENKTGAGGSIGTDFVAKSNPDGYTLLLVSPGYAVIPSLQKNVTWNPVRDFRSVAGIGVVPNVIVVHPSVAANTLPELIDLAKKSSAPVTYATAGIGTSNHLAGELLAQEAGIKLTHVPYKGQPDALNDLLAGRVSMMPLTAALAMQHVKAGKLRALAVTTAKHASAAPDLPTVAEAAKLPNYDVGTWFGLVAPAKVPEPVMRKLSADVAAVLATPDMKAKFEGMGMEFAPQSGADFDALVSSEFTRWGRVIKQAGIEPQ
ncbi:MAG: tripartite tricarboxylate transporter substrate binding protein [Comamonadaceae bacterium]|jgi:tripartite-type tricarboxylate transporter receptor subunit TctC|uniref:Tripartite tricarboxylate transporter substrate binding protein n=1 Tax=Hydrogenophaga borbori TaxID=2294117 RepID=A0A372EH86_9BURK|nr:MULTISPECIES: tripartite tricarboxylate transporter substrate binding protein [Hydrogenophaga]NCT97637.1 tripartite tricarboxylate transporter substrate binding protein [Comamonadaceae bacterium]RFP77863.1 tripartite tricarboxylate transporter substrate binding protein [Hydrogenophaga borbori]WQB83150.1 tripartite tricarboxylate transporter substrate binding protein [Hydrogenophaga sp. SNF1]